MNQEILERLDTLAAKLGLVGEHLWAVLVRQAYVSGAIDIFVSIALTVAGILLARYAKDRVANNNNIYCFPVEAVLAIAGVAVLALIALVTLTAGVASIANPEFYALQKVLP